MSDPIQKLFDSLPAPGGNGVQFSLYLNRRYPADDNSRYVCRVLGKNFTGNDIADILLVAKLYAENKLRPQPPAPPAQPGNDY